MTPSEPTPPPQVPPVPSQPSSPPAPPYERLRVSLIDRMRSGDLAAGSRLPTVRALAGELGLAANTVARAYRELEADHFIETRGRNGSFVRAQGNAAEMAAQDAAAAYADHIRKLGIPDDRALAYVAAALTPPPGSGAT